MADEGRRLFANLLALACASGAGVIGYAYFYDFIRTFGIGSIPTSYLLLSAGYAIVMIACIVYLILFLCKCCTCNCKDNCLIRVIIAAALLLGGVIIAIGYFMLVGFAGLYYLGFAILMCGLCVVWALDMGIVDQVKGGGNPQSS